MYLSKLELIGFKSFAHKTGFRFSDGITAIVGPNGCGKTNVVDAIRWVLGEQKTTVLRSEIMENVIFNGSSSRKPLGLAEVSITLQNNKNVLPTEYSEVTVSRRLFRNGESQYLLNNTQCRLKDILDLFMDTGIGSDSYSVIELKMVEAILSGKPEERRHLLEEAAGVTRYKARRKEAGKKLQNVQNDLLRIQDIVQEVQKNVSSLSRQAAKTRRYNSLLGELRELEKALIVHEYEGYRLEIESLGKEIGKLKDEKLLQETALSAKEEYLTELKESLSSLDEKYQSAMEEENAVNLEISRKNKDIAVIEEKIRALKEKQERIKQELEELRESLENSEESLKSSEENLQNLSEAKKESVAEFEAGKTKKSDALEIVRKKRERVSSSNEEVINVQNRIDTLKSELKKNVTQRGNLEKSRSEAQEEIDRINSAIEAALGEITQIESGKNALEYNLSEAQVNLKSAQTLQDELRVKLENQQSNIVEQRNVLNLKSASLEFLTSLVDYDESSKFLFGKADWQPAGGKMTLAESISADEEIRIAMDAALGEFGKCFVVATKKEAEDGISLLNANNKGRATFICRELIPDAPQSAIAPRAKGIIGRAAAMVRADDELLKALRLILGDMLIAETLEAAADAVVQGLAESAVTLKGELYKKGGIIRGGSAPRAETLTIGKQERIAALNREIESFQNEISKLEESYNNIRDEYNSIDIKTLSENLRKTEISLNENENIIKQLSIKRESFEQNRQLHSKNLENIEKNISEIISSDENAAEELRTLDTDLFAAKEGQTGILFELAKNEAYLAQCDEELRSAEMNKVRLEEEIKSTEREKEQLRQQKSSIERKIENNIKEIAQNENRLQECEGQIASMQNELSSLQDGAEEKQNRREYLHEQISVMQEQVRQYSAELIDVRRAFDKLNETLHLRELRMSELRTQINNSKRQLLEKCEIDIESETLETVENFSIDEARAAIAVLKEKLLSLGNINFAALEEFENQSERLKFYNEQIMDLESSERNLQETISEINQTAEKQFLDTFNEIELHFKLLFKTLFGEEGDADMLLAEGDPLEANIEINAKPPGKKPHSIEMLSGGEKTLTAIALLFAIYLVKPSPFCILDEVDAPLDDANIDKFLDLIKKFSNNTQFLIVTHNKRTMESSDSLYGITMPEEGVSKVVSVRLSPDLA